MTGIQEEKETGRLEAFSDGVFAIAITLLVLEIKAPSHESVQQHGLAHLLAALWPSYLAFFTSFITILVMWVNHHHIFTLIRRSDHAFLYLNGLLLFLVTFVPFPTSLLAEFLLDPDGKVAANLYTGTFLAISFAFNLLWRYAAKGKRLLAAGAKREEVDQISKLGRTGFPLYLAAFGASFVSESASIGICLLLALYFALRGWPIKT